MRILLFLAANIVITITLGIIGMILFTVLGIDMDGLAGLLLFSLVIGFGGSFGSLLLSKWIAKHSVGAVTIKTPSTETEKWLMQTVEKQAQTLGFKMPEVAIYEGEMNAFATGAFKNSALVAVSTGLLEKMSRDEVEAVLAHEMSHVNNGDMITMTLLQGLANTFVIFVSRLVASAFKNGLARFAVRIGLQIGLMFLASLVIFWFSRRREYAADAGAAALVGAPKMIAALKRLQAPVAEEDELPEDLVVFGISGGNKDSFMSTHPSLENRILALENPTTITAGKVGDRFAR